MMSQILNTTSRFHDVNEGTAPPTGHTTDVTDGECQRYTSKENAVPREIKSNSSNIAPPSPIENVEFPALPPIPMSPEDDVAKSASKSALAAANEMVSSAADGIAL